MSAREKGHLKYNAMFPFNGSLVTDSQLPSYTPCFQPNKYTFTQSELRQTVTFAPIGMVEYITCTFTCIQAITIWTDTQGTCFYESLDEAYFLARKHQRVYQFVHSIVAMEKAKSKASNLTWKGQRGQRKYNLNHLSIDGLILINSGVKDTDEYKINYKK